MIRGVIFDLDGTLVDSQLDFDAMRAEMRLPVGVPILESMKHLPEDHASHCRAILHQHELAGADRAVVLPGVSALLTELRQRGKRLAVVTRNSREVTLRTLERVELAFDPIITRCDGPSKPDPWPILSVCAAWELTPRDVVMVGDYRFDIECGQAAGCATVLYTSGISAASHPNQERADYLLPSFDDHHPFLSWLDRTI